MFGVRGSAFEVRCSMLPLGATNSESCDIPQAHSPSPFRVSALTSGAFLAPQSLVREPRNLPTSGLASHIQDGVAPNPGLKSGVAVCIPEW
jgi:hypothetical protein